MFDSLLRMLGGGRHSAVRAKAKNHVVPSLEALEERWVPSTISSPSMHSLLGTGFTTLSTPTTNPPSNSSSTPDQQVTAAFTPFKTGGSETQSVAQFDPSLGTLNSVQVLLNGKLTSDVKVENLDNAPSTVNAQVNGNLSLQGPNGTLLSLAPTLTENTTSLSAYDGKLDYGGTSGHDFGARSASARKSIALTNNLSAWEGNGKVDLTETAQSSSTVSGSGNEQIHIASEGSGTVTVIYDYTPKPQSPPPAPPPAPPAPPPCPCECHETPPSGPAAISGLVYVAPNSSDPYDPSDPGANNVTVTLTGITLTQQQVTQTTTTDPNGSYQFTDLQPGIYALTDQPVPSQYTAGTTMLGSLGGVANNGELILALPQGGDAANYDFGLVLAAPNVTPTSPPPIPSPPPISPPPAPAPAPTPSVDPLPVVVSKRSLLGDGWQSLG